MGVTQHELSKHGVGRFHSFTHPASTAQDITESLAYISFHPPQKQRQTLTQRI